MKLIVSHEKKQRPYAWGLTAVTLVSIAGLLVITANKVMLESEIGQAMIVLARVGIGVIPPVIWIGAVLIVAIWLVLLVRVWQV